MAASMKRKPETSLNEISENEPSDPPIKQHKTNEAVEEEDDDMIGPVPEQEVKPKRNKGQCKQGTEFIGLFWCNCHLCVCNCK